MQRNLSNGFKRNPGSSSKGGVSRTRPLPTPAHLLPLEIAAAQALQTPSRVLQTPCVQSDSLICPHTPPFGGRYLFISAAADEFIEGRTPGATQWIKVWNCFCSLFSLFFLDDSPSEAAVRDVNVEGYGHG